MQWLSFKKVKKVMFTGKWRSSRRPETPLTGQGAEENGVYAPFNSSKTRGKSCDKTLAEATELWPPQSVWANPPCTRCWETICGEALQDDVSPRAFGQLCSHEGPKMQGNPPGDGRGTLPNLMLMDEKKFDIQQVVNQQNNRVWASSTSTEGRIVTRRQNSQSVMIWAIVTEAERSPLLFVPTGVKLNCQRYIADILEDCLRLWAKKHF